MKYSIRTIIGTLSISALAYTAAAQVAGESVPSGGPADPQTPEQVDPDPAAPALPQADPAEQAQKPAEQAQTPDQGSSEESTSVLAGTATASDLIGMRVESLQGDKLGKIQEIAVDLESGRIVQMILATGGFIGIGTAETAVPPRAFTLDEGRQHLKLDAGKEDVDGAPSYDGVEWSQAFSQERLTATYEHFGVESSLDFVDGEDQSEGAFRIPASRLESVQRASEIVGMEVKNLQGDALGDISEIMFDPSAGRILALVIDSGGYLGIEGELSAIPATEFRFSTDRDLLVIDTSKEALAAAPHFQSNDWPDFTNAEIAEEVFAAYSVEPYFRQGANTGSAVIVGANPDTNEEATQGEGPGDMAMTSAIRREIRELENISLTARKVSVVTRDGHTVLSGDVETAEEKQAIEEIATRNNQEAGVENLIEVKDTKSDTE